MSTIQHFAEIPVFGQLSVDMREHLAAASEVFEYRPRHLFFNQGDQLEHLYALINGHVKLYRQSGERTQILALLGNGDCFATEAISDDSGSSYAAATMTQSTAILIPVNAIQQLLETNPEFRVLLLQVVTARLRQFAGLVHDLAFRDVTARLAMILVTRAKYDGVSTPGGIRISRLMTQSELASMVGTAREVVHRTFKKFEEQGLTRISRNEIMIFDLEGLRVIAEEENR